MKVYLMDFDIPKQSIVLPKYRINSLFGISWLTITDFIGFESCHGHVVAVTRKTRLLMCLHNVKRLANMYPSEKYC